MKLRRRWKRFLGNDIHIARFYFGLIILMGVLSAVFLQSWLIEVALLLAIAPGVALNIFQIVIYLRRGDKIDFGYTAMGYMGSILLGAVFFTSMITAAAFIGLFFGHPIFGPLSS